MAMLSMELIAFMLLAFMMNSLLKRNPLSQQWLHNLKFYLFPDLPQVKLVADTRAQVGNKATSNNTLADGTDLRPSWWGATLGERIQGLLEHNKAFLQSGIQHNASMHWDKLRMMTEFDLVVSVLVQLLAIYGLSSAVSCVRGTEPQETSFYLTILTVVLSLYVLVDSVFRHGWGSVSGPIAIGFGGVGFVLALLALQAPESMLDTRLAAGLVDTRVRANDVLSAVVEGAGPPSDNGATGAFLTAHFVVAGIAGLLSASMVIPALRFASCYAALAKDSSLTALTRACLYANMFAPMATAALWLRPVVGALVLAPDLVKCSPQDLARDCAVTTDLAASGYLTETQWLRVRLGAVALCLILRLVQFRLFMGAYMAQSKTKQGDFLEHSLGGFGSADAAKAVKKASKKARKTGADVAAAAATATSVSPEALAILFRKCRSIAQTTFSNIPVVALQLLAPTVATIALLLALHRRGGVSMGACDALHAGVSAAGGESWMAALKHTGPVKPSSLDQVMAWAMQSVGSEVGAEFAAQLRQAVASPHLWRPMMSFLVWWAVLSSALASGLAYMYFEGVTRFSDSSRDELRTQAQTTRRAGAGGETPPAPATGRKGKRKGKKSKTS